jgi:hypothetical protein
MEEPGAEIRVVGQPQFPDIRHWSPKRRTHDRRDGRSGDSVRRDRSESDDE